MEGEEQNLDNKYEITMEDLSNAIFDNVETTAGDKGLEELLSKEFPNYTRIESYPGSNMAFRIYYPSAGKMVSSVLKKVQLTSTTSFLVKLSNDYINKDNVNWQKELSKFTLSGMAGNATGAVIGGMVTGPMGIGVAVISSGAAGAIVDTSVGKLWDRIESFNNGGGPLDK